MALHCVLHLIELQIEVNCQQYFLQDGCAEPNKIESGNNGIFLVSLGWWDTLLSQESK